MPAASCAAGAEEPPVRPTTYGPSSSSGTSTSNVLPSNVPHLDLGTGSHPFQPAKRFNHRHSPGRTIFKRYRNHNPRLLADQQNHPRLQIHVRPAMLPAYNFKT
jgi:hypothetical protein